MIGQYASRTGMGICTHLNGFIFTSSRFTFAWLSSVEKQIIYRLIRLKIRSFTRCKNFPGSLFHCITGFIGFIRLKIRNVRWERIYLLYFTNIRGKETQETQVIRHEKKLALAIFSFITNRESIKER